VNGQSYARTITFQLAEVAVKGPTHGQGHPNCDPPPSSAAVMCVTAILTETERKWPNRSVHRADEWRSWAEMMRVCGPICPHPGVPATADATQSAKHLINRKNQAIFRLVAGYLGDVGSVG
jgi:hypothetical protein